MYGAEFDLCELLQTLTLSKGKTKVSTSPSLSHIHLTPQWRKAPENDPTVPVVPYALQRASEDVANTEDPAYHVSAIKTMSILTMKLMTHLVRRGIIKFKVQLLRSSHHNHNLHPHQPPAQLLYPSPALSASRMPLPPIHPRFTRPRIPRALSVPLPLPRVITIPDDGRRIPGHDSHSSRPAQCISTCTQRLCDCPAGNSKSSRSEGVAGRS